MRVDRRFWELEAYADATALIANGNAISYRELAAQCDRLAALFGPSKKLVWIDVHNDVESIVGYLAALRAGHAAMLIPSGMDPGTRSALLERYDPDFVWRAAKRDEASTLPGGSYILSERSAASGAIHPALSLLLATSGSTGSAKFVRLRGTGVDANARSIREYLCIGADDTAITSLPIHYSYGLSVLNSHLAAGARIVVTNASIINREFWQAFTDWGVTSLAGVPYSYEMFKRVGFQRMTLPSLRYLTQAGGKLSDHVIREFLTLGQEKGFRLCVMYGQTEATARIAYLPSEHLHDKVGSIGQAIPGGQLWLQDANGNVVREAGVEGVLMYRGENTMLGYALSRGDLAKPDELGGVLRTGDVARFDSDGYFYITGRESRFVKLLGNRISLDEIETSLRSNGVECLCGGSDDVLKVAYKEGGGTKEKVEKLIASRYKLPRFLYSVRAVEEFQKTSSGKNDYARIFAED